MGNLGSDPEIKATNEGSVCTFSLATNEFYGTQIDKKQHTEWHTVVTFGKLAQNCSRYLKKGSRVFLEGRLRTSNYQDKEGRQQYRTKILSASVQFLDSRQHESINSVMLEAMESEESGVSSFESDQSELA